MDRDLLTMLTEANARADREALAHGCSEGVIHAVIHRIGGIVEGNPTGRHNFLQRVDALVKAEARADREATARQEAEQKLESVSLHGTKITDALDAAEAERDALRAELKDVKEQLDFMHESLAGEDI